MGEIINELEEISDMLELPFLGKDMTIREVVKYCKDNRDCMVVGRYKCPLYKEHIGCLFRQGRVPREW